MLKTEWEKQSELERMKEEQQHQKRRTAMREIYDANERQKKDKENELRLERQKDKELIDRIVEKERQIL